MEPDAATLSHVLGTMQKVATDDQMRQQAEQIWQMLDTMHESNPEEYKAFLEQQIKQGPPAAPPQSASKSTPASDAPGRPVLIVTAAVLRLATDASPSRHVDISKIAQQSNQRSADAAVISLFECSDVVVPSTGSEPWDPARHSATRLRHDSVEFRVRI